MRLLIGIVIAIVFAGCSSGDHSLKKGIWRGVIEIQPGQELPFTFEVVTAQDSSLDVYIKNADEKLLLDEVTYEGDSVVMTLHVFDAVLKGKVNGGELKGYYIKNYEKNYRIPFAAQYGQDYRFEKTSATSEADFTGKYAVTFTNDSDTTIAVGIFKQDGNHITGTFLTTTGDYRFIEGSVIGKKMHMSTFDGNHAYLFTAEKENETTLKGEYWSGKTWHQTWTGIKDENASLPDAESLTYLKPGFDKIEFTFPDVNGKNVSLADDKYKDKVVVLQIFGTWCPNCMDETKFLKPWYEKNKDRGVEIIGLAYERKPEFDYASERVRKMQAKLEVPYDFVIAGTNDKAKAGETLPMLNAIVAFPTTIFVGKDGKVKKIHTGFSGPGTGVYYDQFIQHFNETINELLAENPALSKK